MLAALVFMGDESHFLWLPIIIGLIPIAMVIAFMHRLPLSRLMLFTYCAVTVALGGVVLVATLVESVVNVEVWATPSRLVLSLHVAVGAMLLVALSGTRDRWGNHD